MKSLTKTLSNKWTLLTGISVFLFFACQKQIDSGKPNELAPMANSNNNHGHLNQTKTFSSDVILKWIDLNNRILIATARVGPGVKSNREFGYIGIAAYEAVVPGMPAYQSLSTQLNQMPQMPFTQPGMAYHWALSANAALAAMNRYFYPTASAANKVSIDSLENALNTAYQNEVNADEYQRSIQFGKDVALKIFDWSKTDGADHGFDADTLQTGPGFWVPTPPAFAVAVAPRWGANRLFVRGSIDGALPPPPLSYSEDPSSDYYKMEKEVYDASVNLTLEQRNIALFWLDAGFGAGGHWQSIIRQVLQKENSALDIAALAYAKGGIYINDASISSFKTKYFYSVQRPITYIRSVLNHPTWNSLIATPAHPDYGSAHTVQSIAVATALASIFGNNYSFTDHTNEGIGMVPQSYQSFEDVAEQVARARVYAGIHTRMGCEAGLNEGLKVAQNIDKRLKFLKE